MHVQLDLSQSEHSRTHILMTLSPGIDICRILLCSKIHKLTLFWEGTENLYTWKRA